MAMSDCMAMALGVPCYGHDHAMFAVRNMVMSVSWSWPCHSQGKSLGESDVIREEEAEKGSEDVRELQEL